MHTEADGLGGSWPAAEAHRNACAAGGAGTLRKGSVLSSRFSAPKGTVTQEDSRGDRGRWKTALAT